VTLTPLHVETGTTKLDLSLAFWKTPGGALEAAAEFTLDRFEPATVRRMLGHLAVLLAGALQAPEARIGDLPLLTAEESLQLQAAWSCGDPLPASAPTLHGLFESQARRHPGALALVHGSERLTYGELDARTERLARRLAALGVRPETRVALSAGRGTELAVGFLGILRAGGVCVPLDPDHPAERLAFVLEDAGAIAIVTTAAIAPRLPSADLPRVLVDAPEAEEPVDGSLVPALPGNLAYVIYTSGSTGRPKGVAVPHHAAAAHCEAVIQLYGLVAADRLPQFASPAFDVAVEEIFATFAAGAALVMRGDEPWGIGELAEKFDELELTVVNLPTAAWQHWVGELGLLAAPPPSLRLLIIGGEEALAETARQWLRTPFSAVRLLNGYGPTEAVITPTLYEVGSGDSGRGASVPIGRPLPGRSARVLDRRSAAMPAGVPGELCMGGDLARGYLGQPALTAERFVPDPFGEPGSRLYRTGDLVRLLPGGDLEFLGRIDQQVKVRGFRIELAEIEAALAAHPAVTAAAVLVQDTAGDRRLVAYAATRADQEVTPAELRQALQGRLPDYMVPSVYVLLDSLPCTPNGKVDRRALPVPELARGVDDELVAPRTTVEEQVAEVWQAVLGIGRVGVYDSFWELGGHSLLATKVLSRLSEAFGVHLPLKTLFVNPRLGELAEAVGRAVLADEADDGDSLLSELEGLSDEEIRELLAAEEEEALEER
jgi:amino acid adenylation domain-containing protein